MIFISMTIIYELHQNVLPMKIALLHRTHVDPIFVSVGQRTNAQEDPMYVQLGNANVVKTMNVHLQSIVLLENA